MDNQKRDNIKKYLLAGFMLLICIVLLQSLFGFLGGKLDQPLTYSSDGIMEYTIAKIIVETGWVWGTESLGAPFGNSMLDFAPATMDVFNLVIMKIISFFTKNPFVIVNLLYILTFIFISLTSYFTMCELKLDYFVSAELSLVFAFFPYIFLRGINHLVLSTYQFVPLSILLCIWLYNGILLHKGKMPLRNICTIIFCILIGTNGIAYYPFFTCVLLMVTALCAALKRKSFKPFLKGVICCFIIAATMILTLLPNLCYHIKNGTNYLVGKRGPEEAEIYGFKLMQLFIPVNPSPIKWINSVQNAYARAPLPNEGMSYLGIVAIIGFMLLLVGIIVSGNTFNKNYNDTIVILQRINLAAVLVGTIGGFGSLFSFFITSSLRGYNRISIFIGFISILAIGCYISDIMLRTQLLTKKLILCIMTCICIISIAEQIPWTITDNLDLQKSEQYNDKDFIARIENTVADGSMIYQLPFHSYPESGNSNAMGDYDLFKPYLYSNKLKWSFGVTRGRMGATWNEMVSTLPVSDMINNLCYAGYAGIYINREGYLPEEWKELEQQLRVLLDTEAIVNNSQKQSFFSLQQYKQSLKERDALWDQHADNVFQKYPLGIKYGAFNIEGNIATGQWIWLADNSGICIYNYKDEPIKSFQVQFKLTTDFEGEYWAEVSVGNKTREYTFETSVEVRLEMDLEPGENIISIKTNAPQVYAPNDVRKLFLRISNFNFEQQ